MPKDTEMRDSTYMVRMHGDLTKNKFTPDGVAQRAQSCPDVNALMWFKNTPSPQGPIEVRQDEDKTEKKDMVDLTRHRGSNLSGK